MYKYTTKDHIRDYLLSLDLFEDKSMSDKKKMRLLYTISNDIENNYATYRIPKRHGGYRTICEPSESLKKIQKRILTNYLYDLTPSLYVKSYIVGMNLLDNARVHVGKKLVVKMDIENFFDSVDFLKVYNTVFGLDKMPRPAGMLLCNLCTLYGSLPQGAPTSAYISNLVLSDFDNRLGKYCASKNIDYTRYSDDMTFSGDNFDVKELIATVKKELKCEHLTLNRKKTKTIKNSRSQVVTGICVNAVPQAPKSYRKKIRQELYYIKKYGLDEHIKRTKLDMDKATYLRSLYGRTLFVLSIRKDEEMLNYKKEILYQIKILEGMEITV